MSAQKRVVDTVLGGGVGWPAGSGSRRALKEEINSGDRALSEIDCSRQWDRGFIILCCLSSFPSFMWIINFLKETAPSWAAVALQKPWFRCTAVHQQQGVQGFTWPPATSTNEALPDPFLSSCIVRGKQKMRNEFKMSQDLQEEERKTWESPSYYFQSRRILPDSLDIFR